MSMTDEVKQRKLERINAALGPDRSVAQRANQAVETTDFDLAAFIAHLVSLTEALAVQHSPLAERFVMFAKEVRRASRCEVLLLLIGISQDGAANHQRSAPRYLSYEVRSGAHTYGLCYVAQSSPEFGPPVAPMLAHLCGMQLNWLEQTAILSTKQQVGHTNDLTPREREVLPLLCQATDDATIAQTLCIAPTTVRTHRKNIYAKLGVRCPADLLLMAYQQRLCSPLEWL